MKNPVKQIVVKLASKVLRARSESFTESDASYASSSNETSDVSSADTETSESTANATTSCPSKGTITQVTVPRRIVIKYSANIEQPKMRPPIAVIGPRDSESSDPGILESDYSEEEEAEEGEQDDDEEDESKCTTKDEITAADASEITTETQQTYNQDESDAETEIEEDESETESEDEEESDESTASESHTNINGHVNGVQATKGYNLEDFQLLKTIGKLNIRTIQNRNNRHTITHKYQLHL